MKITKERLQEIAEDGFLKHGESKELARIALAAMQQEPVGKLLALAAEVQAIRWASGQVYAAGYNHGHLNTVDGLPYAEEKDLIMRGGETLHEYIDPDHCGVATDAILAEVRATAQPAPVVPDEMTKRKACREYSGRIEVIEGYRDGWNACRAAMLNGGKL